MTILRAEMARAEAAVKKHGQMVVVTPARFTFDVYGWKCEVGVWIGAERQVTQVAGNVCDSPENAVTAFIAALPSGA
jgi:hypothetical protein